MAATSQGGGNDAPNLSAEALFGSLFEQSAMGIAVFSLGGRFLRANAAMCRMLGYSEQELLQKHRSVPQRRLRGKRGRRAQGEPPRSVPFFMEGNFRPIA